MAHKNNIFICLLLIWASPNLEAQKLIIGNGGLFGSSTDFVNLQIYDPQSNTQSSLDTIYNNSIQDIFIEENQFAYIASEDSIIKYDLISKQRIASCSFGAVNTIKLGIYQNKLLAGNWYGSTQGNLRIFDKNTLQFLDSIPEITQGATDFIIYGNKALIAQNNSNSMWMDTLGYIAVVDLDLVQFIRNDTLSSSGHEIGRLVLAQDSLLFSINTVSQTISMFNLQSNFKTTYNSPVSFMPLSIGNYAIPYQNTFFMPFGDSLGIFDLVQNQVVQHGIAPLTAYGFAFAVDSIQNRIYINHLDFSNQNNNRGEIYSLNRQFLGNYTVGFSPELLQVWYPSTQTNTVIENTTQIKTVVFPNPFTDYVQIKSTEPMNEISVFSQNGLCLSRKQVHSTDYQLDLTGLNKGTYFVMVQGSKGFSTIKIQKVNE